MTIIVLNFKTYSESTGDAALELSRICEEVAKSYGVNIAVAPQAVDIRYIASNIDIPVYAQHVDLAKYGSFTGRVTPMAIKEAGAIGTLINHSERRLQLADIDGNVTICKALGLKTIVCTNNVNTTMAAACLHPDFVAIEPPELIGSGIPVSKADPGVVKGSVETVKKINRIVGVLCGAGITHGEDLKAALELGSDGVLLASGIIRAKDQKAALEDLVTGV